MALIVDKARESEEYMCSSIGSCQDQPIACFLNLGAPFMAASGCERHSSKIQKQC